MSMFHIQLEVEIAILVFASLFAIGAIGIAILLCYKVISATADVRENPESLPKIQRIQEVSVITIREQKVIKSGKTEKPVKTGKPQYVHCPSPTYEPNYEFSNPAFEYDEDFVNVIASF